MLSDQENYDTFEYDDPDGEMYEPLSDPIIIPKTNAPPLPPARNKLKQDAQKKPLNLPKHSKLEFKNATPPRFNPMQLPPQIPDCDENYEEFPCDNNQDDFPEENYESFENEILEDDPPPKKKPPLPNRKLSNEKPKLDIKPQSYVTKFKFSDLTKSKEKPQPPPKDSFQFEINNKMKRLHLAGKDTTPSGIRKTSITCDQPIKAPKRNSSDNIHSPPQQVQQEQEDTDEEDPREVYADACDVRLFLQNKPWYFGKLGRKAEESLLNDIKQNGAYLLRDSSQASITHPFTLTVYTNNHFYRLKIRHLESGKFVVGEKKESEIEFNTIPDLITYYQTEPLLLLATANNSNSCTTLKYIPEKNKGLNL